MIRTGTAALGAFVAIILPACVSAPREPVHRPAPTAGAAEKFVPGVKPGLAWLARSQEADGHWDCGKHGGAAKESLDVAVTGLALRAFYWAGSQETDGIYAANVRKCLDWLEKNQAKSGAFSKSNFAHGICALAVVENWQSTQRRKEMAQKAVDWIVASQKPSGGWDDGDGGDPLRDRSVTSVTAWQAAALISAKEAELNVPQPALDNLLKFLRSATDVMSPKPSADVAREIADGKIVPGGIAGTAMAVDFCQRIGFSKDAPFVVAGLERMGNMGPQRFDELDLSYIYYATKARARMSRESFLPWFYAVERLLHPLQEKQSGDRLGSWPSEKESFGKDGGRVYTTAMAILCLTEPPPRRYYE